LLQQVEIPVGLDERSIPAATEGWIQQLLQRIEAFQDRWEVEQIEQFVAADYRFVYQTLSWVRETQLLTNNRFVEWGCGFAAVTTMAAQLGWSAVGIESEEVLLKHGRRTIADESESERKQEGQSAEDRSNSLTCRSGLDVELIAGNFLPAGAERLADDPTLPSVGHPTPPAYGTLGLDLDDFGTVYSYPWPGENLFHQMVFDRYGGRGALLVEFCGPNEVRVWRKIGDH